MSDRPVRIVRAPPPGKNPAPRRLSAGAKPTAGRPASPERVGAPLTSSAAITTFLGLLTVWRLPPAQGWRMLTGLGYRAGSLTPDQIERVQHLVAIDAGMRMIRGDTVGEWIVAGNGAAVLSGSAPVAFLTRAGLPGYAALARQVERWVEL